MQFKESAVCMIRGNLRQDLVCCSHPVVIVKVFNRSKQSRRTGIYVRNVWGAKREQVTQEE